MTILLVVISLTIIISASCSLYEAVLYSTRMGTLESSKTKQKHPKLSLLFIKLKKNISQPIAAILILNTIANTAGATIAGMYASQTLGTAAVPVFSALLTLSILFFSEIIPKTLGAVHWRSLWPVITYPLEFIKYILFPVIWITEKITYFLTRNVKNSTITEDEILALVHVGAREGEISQEESNMVRNIIHLEDVGVDKIMTPRTVIFSLDSGMTIGQARLAIEGKGFSRILLYEKDKENIIGYTVIHEIYSSKKQTDEKLGDLLRPISFISENTNCLTQLSRFIKEKRHISVVLDEFGGVAGLVSLEDLLETILGAEIVDETDKAVDLQEEARKKRTKMRGDHDKN